MIRNIDTGEEWVPGRYDVSTRIFQRRANAITAAKKLNSEYANSRYGQRNLEAIVIETEVNWREVLL